MEHAVALDHLDRVAEQHRARIRAEERLAALPDHDGCHVERDPIDEAGLQNLAADVGAPSLHHFGLADTYLPAETVERIERALTTGPARTTVLTYDDAGHAFDNPMPAFHHAQAARDAWDNTVTWLSRTAPTG